LARRGKLFRCRGGTDMLESNWGEPAIGLALRSCGLLVSVYKYSRSSSVCLVHLEPGGVGPYAARPSSRREIAAPPQDDRHRNLQPPFHPEEGPHSQIPFTLRRPERPSRRVFPRRPEGSKGERSLGGFRGGGREGIDRRSGEAPSRGDFTFDKVD
jgi:hypothetical protein